ncbi:MAG: TonB-dependent receptor [Pedobacter sp.]|nr:MAG: TonB-dependent receptor [Pedobacter sp.]
MKKNLYKKLYGKILSFICFLFVVMPSAFAQENTGVVKGNISDGTGPLPSASISLSGTKNGTTADANGNYTLRLAAGTYTLVGSYIGYTSVQKMNVKVVAGQETIINFNLEGATQLAEVTVSYGKQKSREVTGSIATVKASDLQDMPVIQFAQQLQGKVAGVNVSLSNGQPGRGINFRIRGAASLATDYQPLFVVDGMPITGSINNINPDEIETFTVLKDASATALYGSRAANGVILITTKHAKPGDSKIEFNSNYGIQKIAENRVPKMMNGTQWAQFMQQRFQDKVLYEGFNAASIPAEYQGDITRYGEGTNWFDVMTRSAPIQSYSLSLQSAREKSSSTVIAGYQEQQGVIVNTGTRLFTLRLNQDLSLSNNKLKIGFNLAPSYRIDHNNRIASDATGGYYERIFESSPIVSPYNADGSYTIGAFSPGMVAYVNPLALVSETIDDYFTTRILGNAYLNYEFIPGLSLKTNLGIDKGGETRKTFNPSIALTTVATTPVQSTGVSSSVDNYSYTGEAFLNYNKTFLTNHNIEALVGYAAQRFYSESNSISGTAFANDDIPYLSNATSITAGTSGTTQYSLLSQIGRLNYNFKGKYLLEAAIRRDGSSRFGADTKYGYFPSLSAGWIISDEKFLENFKLINLLKIRAGYGITGNNTFGNFTAIPTLAKYNYVLNGVLVQGQTIGTLGNSELAWERNKQFDIGLDVSILDSRISLTYDYYRKLSDGLIQVRPIPRASGFANIQFNIGQFEFWGHEISLNTANTTGQVKWNTNLNFSFERNLIKKLVSPGFIRRNNTVTSDYYRNQEGHRLGEFYGFIFEGLYKDAADLANSAKYQATAANPNGVSNIGTVKMRDLNGDGVIDDVNDRTFIGDPTPDFSYGITNNVNYKNWDFSITMAGQVGGQILAASKWAYLTNMDGSRVPLAAALDYWRSEANPGSGVYPRTLVNTTGLGRSVNSQWLEDGSYLTAKNISLGYKFNLKDNKSLRNLRLFASVQQAFIITGYSGSNPEIGLGGSDALSGIGVDENAYPVPRTFSFGISTTFK